MPRADKPKRIKQGIYRVSSGYLLRVPINGKVETKLLPPLELKEIERQHEDFAHEVKQRARRPSPTERHTLREMARTYLDPASGKITEEATRDYRRSHMAAWVDEAGLGDRFFDDITKEDVERALVIFRADYTYRDDTGDEQIRKKRSPKTITEYRAALARLYRVFNGKNAPTPVDGIPPEKPAPKAPRELVSDEQIWTIFETLLARTQMPRLRCRFKGAKTPARFLLLVISGKRPCQVQWIEKGDINFTTGWWLVRPAKGGEGTPVKLNRDLYHALKFFDEQDAYGYFNLSSFAKTLRNAGWPKRVRVYCTRHGALQFAANAGLASALISRVIAGHTTEAVTRKMYVDYHDPEAEETALVTDGRFPQLWTPDTATAALSPERQAALATIPTEAGRAQVRALWEAADAKAARRAQRPQIRAAQGPGHSKFG